MKKIVDHKGNEYPSIAAMCKAHNISYLTYINRKKIGWDLETILTTPIIEKKGKEIEDHLGMKYSSITEMCKVYGVDLHVYLGRIKSGYSMEEALTEKKVYDHKGNEYSSVTEMCEAYHVPISTYHHRIKAGYTLEKALTDKNKQRGGYNRKSCIASNGITYPSIAAMCEAYHIPVDTYRYRIKAGYSMEEALTEKSVIDHKGNEYPSIAAMCKAYGINNDVYRDRFQILGWDLEKTLTAPINNNGGQIIKDHLGVEYPSISAMCKAHNISYVTYYNRIKAGYSMKEALTKPVSPKRNKNSSSQRKC